MQIEAFGIPLVRPFWAHLLTTSHTEPHAAFDGTAVSIRSTDGVRYQLQNTTNLTQWTDQGASITGNGGVLSTPVTLSGSMGFWRWLVVE